MPNWSHLVRFRAKEDGQIHLGQLVDTERDVGLDSVSGREIKAYLINGDAFNGSVTAHILTVEALLSPITREQCSYIRCLGLNYKDHAAEGGFALPEEPELFTKPRTALMSPFPEAVTIPKCAQDGSSDYEAELCIVIGVTGRDIPEDKALDHVLGFTASNDISARTLQLKTKQWCFGKGLDNSCPIGMYTCSHKKQPLSDFDLAMDFVLTKLYVKGPVLVSPAAIGNADALSIKTLYQGNTVQDSHTSKMIFSVRKQIALLSRGTTLEAGTIILTGTPPGIGYFRQPRVVLEDGGRVDVHIEKIGTLVNMVKYEEL